MPTELALREAASPPVPSLPSYMGDYVKQSPDLMAGIRRGVAAFKRGEVTPWEEVKRELGLGQG